MGAYTDEDWNLYAAAGDALNAEDRSSFAAIRAAAPHLDWTGHDRRARALFDEVPYAEQGPDPTWAKLGIGVNPGAPLVPLAANEISRCSTCKALVYWSQTRAGEPCPYDVLPGGYGSAVSHFATCKDAKAHSRKPAGSSRKKAA